MPAELVGSVRRRAGHTAGAAVDGQLSEVHGQCPESRTSRVCAQFTLGHNLGV